MPLALAARRRLQAFASGDEGVGLILVIAISAILATLLAVISATAIRSLSSSSEHVSFESSLAAAEAGIDEELAYIQAARNEVPSVNYETPSGAIGAAHELYAFERRR